jgi:hypothetical protein
MCILQHHAVVCCMLPLMLLGHLDSLNRFPKMPQHCMQAAARYTKCTHAGAQVSLAVAARWVKVTVLPFIVLVCTVATAWLPG